MFKLPKHNSKEISLIKFTSESCTLLLQRVTITNVLEKKTELKFIVFSFKIYEMYSQLGAGVIHSQRISIVNDEMTFTN